MKIIYYVEIKRNLTLFLNGQEKLFSYRNTICYIREKIKNICLFHIHDQEEQMLLYSIYLNLISIYTFNVN